MPFRREFLPPLTDRAAHFGWILSIAVPLGAFVRGKIAHLRQ
jgi:hypothetical protein